MGIGRCLFSPTVSGSLMVVDDWWEGRGLWNDENLE